MLLCLKDLNSCTEQDFVSFGPLDFCPMSTMFLLFVLPLCRCLFPSMDGELCQKWPGETHCYIDLEALN